MTKKILLFLTILLLFNFFSKAQEYNYPLNYYFRNNVEMNLNISDTFVHSSFLPLRVSYTENIINKKNILLNQKRHEFAKKLPLSFIWTRLIAEDIITVKSKNIEFSITPVLDYYKTNSKNDTNFYFQNTRGFYVNGTLGNNLSFFSDFYENQGYFLPYIDNKIQSNFIVPGQGAWKYFGEQKKGRDFNFASGYLSFTPFKFLNIQAGQSKHFVGSGYRSLLLSDNAFSYPFLKFDFTLNKLQFVALFTEFESFRTKYYYYHYKNHGTFLFLNYSPFKNTEIGLFEGIIWQTSDFENYLKRFPALYFVPIPLLRQIIYGLNDNNNSVLGLNFKTNLLKFTEIYSQFAIDNFAASDFQKRYAYQAGFKIYDAFIQKISFAKLFMQAEYNFAKPYTYSHENFRQSYTHYNEPLAHTLGAGFNEFIAIANLQIFNFSFYYKYNNITTSLDSNSTNFGSNILLPNTTANFMNQKNFVGQGNKTLILWHSFNIAYIINPKTNLQVFFSLNQRKISNEIDNNKLFFVSFGVKNSLKNFYYDF